MAKNIQITERISQIIDYLKLTRAEFAKKLNYSHAQGIYNIVDGNSNPSLDFFLRLKESEYGDIFSADWIISGKGSMLSDNPNEVSIVNEPHSVYIKDGKPFKKELFAVETDAFMEVEYIPVQAQAGYLSSLVDHEFFDTKTMLVPKEFEKGNYLVVDVTGDSMDDGTTRAICNGDKLLVKEIEVSNGCYNSLAIRQHLFVIVSSEGIVCKQLTGFDAEKGVITCHSFNSMHDDYELNLKNIFRIFKVKKIVERRISF